MVGVAPSSPTSRSLDRLVPHRRRLRPHLGRTRTPDADYGWVPDCVALAVALPPRDVRSSTPTLTSPHPYKTNPWSWLIQGRPTSFFYEGPKQGADGCLVDQCSKAITSIGTAVDLVGRHARDLRPALHVGAAPRLARRRDPRPASPAATCRGSLLGDRTIYSFYAVAFVPYVVLAVRLRPRAGHRRPRPRVRAPAPVGLGADRRVRRAVAMGLFAFFYPIYTAAGHPATRSGAADVVPQLDLSASARSRQRSALSAQERPSRPGVVSSTTRTASCGSRPAPCRTGTRPPSSRSA